MKTLSANAATAVDSPFVEPVLLLSLEFTGPTVRLASRPFAGHSTYDGALYDPLIQSWSTIRLGEILPRDYTLKAADMTVEINNTEPVGGYSRFSALLGAQDWAYVSATATLVHGGALEAGDGVDVFSGAIENLEVMNRETVTLRLAGRELGFLNAWPHTIVNTDDYPDADPDDVGKMVPQVWGSVKRVPARAVDAGWKTTTAEALDDSETTIDLTDASGLPSSGTVQIDDEQITYTGKSGNSLTGCTRGANATTAVAHDLGATAAEIQTTYFYLVADHAVDAIQAVYVDGVRQASGYTAYTGQSGDQHATYGAQAVVAFSALPKLTKQVNIEADDTIAVNDTIAVSDGITVSDDIDVSDPGHNHTPTEDEIVIWKHEVDSGSGGNLSYPYNWYDDDMDTATTLNSYVSTNAYSEADTTYYRSQAGSPYQMRLCCRVGSVSSGSVDFKYEFCGLTLTMDEGDADSVVRGSWTSLGASYDTWAEINAATGRIERTDRNAGNSVAVKEAWAEIKITPASASTGVSKTGSASKSGTVSKTGSASKSGTVTLTGNSVADTVIGTQVSADVDGYRDDGSGTITGTPDALIERPDHVFAHWLTEALGLTSSGYDSTSYAAAGAEYSSNSWTLGVCLLEPPRVLELFSRAARQSRSLQFFEAGSHHLVYMAASPETDKTLSGHRIDLNQLWIEYTLRAQIRNDLTGLYDRHWSGYDDEVTAERAVVTATASASVAKYGTLAERLELDYVTDAGQAQSILDWIRDDLDEPRLLINLVGDPSLLELERGDVVAFDTTETQLNDALLGLVSSGDQFRVIDKAILPDFKEQIKCVAI